MAINTKNKDVVVAELTKQLAVHKEFLGTASHSAESKAKCSNVTASLVAETAVAWHVEAVGSGGIRGTNDAKTMDHAANLYQKVVENFTSEQFTKFEFPRIVKEDWPTIPKIKYAMADLLYVRKNWEKCGPAFDSVVAEDPTGPQAPEAAFAAVLCYQELYSATHKDGSDRKGSGNLPKGAGKKETQKEKDAKEKAKYAPKEFTKTQEGMITAFNRYLCYIKPSPDQKEDFKNFVEVKYARARTYFEAQRWEEAAAAFREISIDHANMEVGIFAAQLYLESLNVMGSNIEVPRSVCFDDMAADVPKFLDLYCKGGKEKDNAEQCTMLNGIQRDIDRLRAEKYVEEAKNGGANAYALYEKAGRLYEDLWTKYAEAPCAAKDAKGCERADELLYNSAKAYQAARLIAKSISLRKKLLDPTYGLDKGALAMKARYEIGGSYQAIAVYDEAATWYENYAAADPKGEKAADALQDAVVLRLGLGQEDQAIKNADLFNKSYGASKPALAAQIAFAIGEHYADKSDWDQARKRLAGAMGQIDKNATYDIQIQAHALFGRVQSQLNLKSGADTEFKKVAGMWKDPEASLKKIDAASAGPEDKLRRLKKTLTSVGEAFFYFAEQKKAEVDKIKFPEYKGAGNKDDVLKHVNTKVVDWLKKKQPAIEEAEKEYLKVLDLQPSPPPRWVIASGSRVGQMWGKFVAEFRAAPIPKEWKGSGEIPGTNGLTWEEVRGTYYQALDEKSEPQKLRAKAAYKKCLDYSVKYQYFDDYSRKCEQWLSKNYSAEYHLVDEYRGAATRVNTPLKERTRALNADGSFRQEATAAPKPAPEPEAKPGEPSKPGAAKPGDAPASPLDRAQRK
jgi:hypothetical protein